VWFEHVRRDPADGRGATELWGRLLITSLMLFCPKSNHLAEDGGHGRCMVLVQRLVGGRTKGPGGGIEQPRSDIPFGNSRTRRYAMTIGGHPTVEAKGVLWTLRHPFSLAQFELQSCANAVARVQHF